MDVVESHYRHKQLTGKNIMSKKKPTWKNTLHNYNRKFGDINDIAATTLDIGYPYFCWNDRIYLVSEDMHSTTWIETNRTIDDIREPVRTMDIVLACTSAEGTSVLAIFEVECTEVEIDNGEHYQKAKTMARNEKYEGPFVYFDETEQSEITGMAAILKNS